MLRRRAVLQERLLVGKFLTSHHLQGSGLQDIEAHTDLEHSQPKGNPPSATDLVHLPQNERCRDAGEEDMAAFEQRHHEQGLVLLQATGHERDVANRHSTSSSCQRVWQPMRPSFPVATLYAVPKNSGCAATKVHVASEAPSKCPEQHASCFVAHTLWPA